MDKLQLIVLSMIQGLTEFLPISSSAHLILVPQVFGWPDQGLVFDVAVHFGSLIAVVYYFRHEVWRMLKSWSRSVTGGESDQDSLMAWWVIIGTLPAVVFGFLLQEPIEEKLREPWVLATASIAFGLLLWFADAKARRKMTVRLSYDECQTWPVAKVVDAGPAAYSDLAVTKDSQLLLFYEADGYKTLTLARFNLSWLSDGKDHVSSDSQPGNRE